MTDHGILIFVELVIVVGVSLLSFWCCFAKLISPENSGTMGYYTCEENKDVVKYLLFIAMQCEAPSVFQQNTPIALCAWSQTNMLWVPNTSIWSKGFSVQYANMIGKQMRRTNTWDFVFC